MPRKRRFRGIYVGLEDDDRRKLTDMATRDGKTQTEFARDAIRFYLDHKNALEDSARESETAKSIKRMEDRIAGLIARTAIDVGTIYQVLWQRSDREARKNLFEAARNHAIQRLHRKLDTEEVNVRQSLANEMRKE